MYYKLQHSSSTFLQYREKNSKFSYNLLLTVGFFDHSSLWQIFTWLHAATSSSLLDTAASVTAQWAKKWENVGMNNLMRLYDYLKG